MAYANSADPNHNQTVQTQIRLLLKKSTLFAFPPSTLWNKCKQKQTKKQEMSISSAYSITPGSESKMQWTDRQGKVCTNGTLCDYN